MAMKSFRRWGLLAMATLVVGTLPFKVEEKPANTESKIKNLRPLPQVERATAESPDGVLQPLKATYDWGLSFQLDIEMPKIETSSLYFDARPKIDPRHETWFLPRQPSLDLAAPRTNFGLLNVPLPKLDQSGTTWSPTEVAVSLPSAKHYELPDLSYKPEGTAKLRPMSPYCMPGHTSQNFVLYSMHDGLPLHPGVW